MCNLEILDYNIGLQYWQYWILSMSNNPESFEIKRQRQKRSRYLIKVIMYKTTLYLTGYTRNKSLLTKFKISMMKNVKIKFFINF